MWLTGVLEQHIELEKYIIQSVHTIKIIGPFLLYRSEREKYAKHRRKAEKNPDKNFEFDY